MMILAKFFLELEIFQKIKTKIFFWKLCRLLDNVAKYSTDGKPTDDNKTWSMRFPCWIAKATSAHRYVISIAFPQQQ